MIPLLKVKKLIESTIDIINQDYESASQESESWLYRTLNGEELDGYKMYDQAVEVFTRTNKSSRKIKVNVQYDKVLNQSPTIYLRVPSDSKNNLNVIGFGEDIGEYFENTDGSKNLAYSYSRKTTVDCVITGMNQSEILMIYEVMMNAFCSLNLVYLEDFELFEFTGREVMFDSSIFSGIFSRVINLNIDYRNFVPKFSKDTVIENIEFLTPEIED